MLVTMMVLVIAVPLIVVIPISIIGTHYQAQHKQKQKCPVPLRCRQNRWLLMKSSIDELLNKRN